MNKEKLRVTLITLLLLLTLAGTIPAQVGARQTMLDANLATEKELLTLPHMNANIVKGILERRPFLTMKDLNAFLVQSLNANQRKELYGKLFLHLNLNNATKEEILLIPGMGERMLHEFLEYRPYANLAEFRREIGKYVDAKEVARLEQYVFVPIKLNTAKDEEILSIPGMGPKMLHEFKEYRPYKNIEQFRREIGKYVDAKEVARLERYVTLN
jgi:DNA uptake protein ComE-like DNA-binding protein